MSKAPAVTIETLLEEKQEALQLELAAGAKGLQRKIRVPRIQKPGLALTGYEEQLHNDRLLTLGGTEVEYLNTAEPTQRQVGIATVIDSSPACIVVTRGLTPPPELAAACEARSVCLLRSSLVSARFISQVTEWLQQRLSPKTTLHGALLEVLGVGVLILGKSGIGKSEAALELVHRSHRLVADDVVEVRRVGPNLVYGNGVGLIKHHMEIRGLGILNIKDLFGISAVREQKRIELVVELCEWAPGEEYERLGIDERIYPLLGEELPIIRLPVRPGRNISTLIEVAARNQILKRGGHNSAQILAEKLDATLSGSTSCGEGYAE